MESPFSFLPPPVGKIRIFLDYKLNIDFKWSFYIVEKWSGVLAFSKYSNIYFRKIDEFVVKIGYVISQVIKSLENSGYIAIGIALGIE